MLLYTTAVFDDDALVFAIDGILKKRILAYTIRAFLCIYIYTFSIFSWARREKTRQIDRFRRSFPILRNDICVISIIVVVDQRYCAIVYRSKSTVANENADRRALMTRHNTDSANLINTSNRYVTAI